MKGRWAPRLRSFWSMAFLGGWAQWGSMIVFIHDKSRFQCSSCPLQPWASELLTVCSGQLSLLPSTTRSSAVVEMPRALNAIQGHSKWRPWIGRVYKCVLVLYCNFVYIFYRFWDIQLRIMAWPWILGQGSFTVIESGTSLSHMTYYQSAIVTIALSWTVVELFDVE